MQNCEQKATIGTVKSSLKIPPGHNGVVPIKITGPVIKNIGLTSSQMKIQQKVRIPTSISLTAFTRSKGKRVNIVVSNYTNKHVTFLTKENTKDTLNPP